MKNNSNQKASEAPQGYESEEVESYLDTLRDSGAINMFAATPYIVETFGVGKSLAQEYLRYYMKRPE